MYFSKLSDRELFEIYEGNNEWTGTKVLNDNNPLNLICDKYENDCSGKIDIAEAVEATLYEMAFRYYKIKNN